ncbi:MAG: dual specificity protein phosphatase family protein [Phycisphaeraceae bacterium]|nr:dual specificity protein phosphatase family protein [Phycisphaeraceae bacterium]
MPLVTNNNLDKSHDSSKKPKNNSLLCWIIAIVLLTTVSAVVWRKYLREHFVVVRWAQVEPGLYRSSEMSRSMCEYMLNKHGIEVIISLGADIPGDLDKLPEQEASAKLGIDRTAIEMSGNGTGTIESYVQALTLLVKARQANKIVLVHCGSGTQRTGGVIACYKMLTQNVPPDQARANMESFDFSASGNPILLPFLNKIMPQLAKQLKADNVIDTLPDPLPVLAE